MPRTPINTHGWDLVLSLSLASVNNALAADPSLLLSSFRFVEDRGPTPFRLEGLFGAWRVTGGSGQNIKLALPIDEGSLEISETGSAIIPAGDYNLAGTCVELEVRLDFTPTLGSGGAASLVFSFEDTGEAHLIGDIVHAAGIAKLAIDQRALIGPLISDAVARCLSANADKVQFVFSQIAPQGVLTDEAQKLAYAMVTTPGGRHNLCIFCSSTSMVSQPAEVSGLPLCTDGMFVAAISQHIVLDRMLKPAIARSLWETQFPVNQLVGGASEWSLPVPIDTAQTPYDVDPAIFQTAILSPTRASISCASPFNLKLLRGTDAETFEIREFSCQLSGDKITIDAEIHKYLDLLLWKIPISARMNLSLKANFEGGLSKSIGQAGLKFVVTGETRDTSIGREVVAGIWGSLIGEMATRLIDALKTALEDINLPVAITMFNGSELHATDAYLAGSLCLSGETALDSLQAGRCSP